MGLRDLSFNNLSGRVDWRSVSAAFQTSLVFLSIIGNPGLSPSPVPPFLEPLNTSTPYDGFSCAVLSFSGFRESFFYDESLFQYQTCLCGAGTFGSVKDGCQSCDGAMPGSVECLGGSSFAISSNFYPYYDSNGTLCTELCVSNPDLIPEEVNPCPSGETHGTLDVYNGNPALCRTGATGRRCSECICSMNETEACYFKKSHYCARCSSSSTSLKEGFFLALLAVVLIIGVVVVSGIFAFLVKRRMENGDEGQNFGLPIGFFGILQFFITHGIIKVVIQFVQFASELTSWNGAINAYFLRLSNFDVSGFGVQCVFREFTRPVPMFMLKLSVGFGLLALLWICVGLAAATVIILKRYKSVKHPKTADKDICIQPNDGIDPDEDVHPRRICSEKMMIQFTRFGVSLSLTLVNLFYFGVSTTIISAFFSDSQLGTSNVFMSLHPYIPWSDSRAKHVRIVAGLFFFFVPLVPIGTLVLLIIFRHRRDELRVKSYIGALFRFYRPSVFWWEMVLLTRKFLVASLASIATHQSLRSWLIATCLGAFLILQLYVRPWKRRVENLIDEAASVVLMIALFAHMKTPIGDTGGGRLLVIGRVMMALFVVVALAIWLWNVFEEVKQFHRLLPGAIGQQQQKQNDDVGIELDALDEEKPKERRGAPEAEAEKTENQTLSYEMDVLPLKRLNPIRLSQDSDL